MGPETATCFSKLAYPATGPRWLLGSAHHEIAESCGASWGGKRLGYEAPIVIYTTHPS